MRPRTGADGTDWEDREELEVISERLIEHELPLIYQDLENERIFSVRTRMSTKKHELFFELVQLALEHRDKLSQVPTDDEWAAVKELADRQGLTAVVLDGLSELRNQGVTKGMPEQIMLLEWIGEVMQGYEMQYDQHRKAIAELARFYNEHGFKMMVLKGYACSLDWPRPEHRPCGDIDIWLFGRQREADETLGSWFKVQGSSQGIDSGHHHHTVFYWNDIMVENHYDFVNVHHHKSNEGMERLMKELAGDDSYYMELEGARVYLPSPNLHAFFLLRHAMNHFAASEISLRQLLDWAFFVKKHGDEVDWDRLMKEFEKYKMMEMFNIFNAICVDDLGFDANIFRSVQFNPDLKERVLEDILYPAYVTAEPKHLLPRLIYKYKRWQGNGWKQRLCYPDSRWSTFWSGVWSHLLKPGSI